MHVAAVFRCLQIFCLGEAECYPQKREAKILTFNVHRSVHHNNILIYIQQDATLHSLFYLETAVHVSGGTITGPCIIIIF